MLSLSVPLQSSLIDLKEHASSLASSSLKKESKLKSLEMAIEQKKEECSKLETQLQKVGVLALHHLKMSMEVGNAWLGFENTAYSQRPLRFHSDVYYAN